MINLLRITNLAPADLDINTNIYPVHLFNVTSEARNEKRAKAGFDGAWPTFPYLGGMTIEMEGAILADDPDTYYTRRQALVDHIRYQPATRLRRNGTMVLGLDGSTENWETDFVIDEFNSPLPATSPNFSEFRFVVYSFTPYFTGVTSGDFYYYS